MGDLRDFAGSANSPGGPEVDGIVESSPTGVSTPREAYTVRWARRLRALPFILLAGCAGQMRSCSAGMAERFGADWLIAQYKTDGTPLHCWRLPDTSVVNETGSDGIYWKDPRGHLVHISGWYNRVQVTGGDWAGAAASIGVDIGVCR